MIEFRSSGGVYEFTCMSLRIGWRNRSRIRDNRCQRERVALQRTLSDGGIGFLERGEGAGFVAELHELVETVVAVSKLHTVPAAYHRVLHRKRLLIVLPIAFDADASPPRLLATVHTPPPQPSLPMLLQPVGHAGLARARVALLEQLRDRRAVAGSEKARVGQHVRAVRARAAGGRCRHVPRRRPGGGVDGL